MQTVHPRRVLIKSAQREICISFGDGLTASVCITAGSICASCVLWGRPIQTSLCIGLGVSSVARQILFLRQYPCRLQCWGYIQILAILSMIYLHHYPASLFSEKIRVLLGHYQLDWHSVEISSIMPRPLLMPLSGGYRRTPVLQIGANVYSDTKIICSALARHVGDSQLYNPASGAGFAAHRAADWADSQLFKVVVALNFRPEAMVSMMGKFTPEEAKAFAEDRAKLSGNQPIASLTPSAAMAYLHHTLAELEANLTTTGAFLYGDSPCIADFSVYHNIWFLLNNSVNAPLVEAFHAVMAWVERMRAIGHGKVIESDGNKALGAALSADPVLPDLGDKLLQGIELGERVAVTPIDYGCIPVVGTLVGCDHAEVVIQRESDEAGTVFNHFPMPGFDVEAASSP